MKSTTPPTPLLLCSSSSVYILFDFANLLLSFETVFSVHFRLSRRPNTAKYTRALLPCPVFGLAASYPTIATLPENMYFKLPTSKHTPKVYV